MSHPRNYRLGRTPHVEGRLLGPLSTQPEPATAQPKSQSTDIEPADLPPEATATPPLTPNALIAGVPRRLHQHQTLKRRSILTKVVAKQAPKPILPQLRYEQ